MDKIIILCANQEDAQKEFDKDSTDSLYYQPVSCSKTNLVIHTYRVTYYYRTFYSDFDGYSFDNYSMSNMLYGLGGGEKYDKAVSIGESLLKHDNDFREKILYADEDIYLSD
ncbi:hypothetical protein HB884_05930 [Listeria booriae]|uniref:hypothetical protein n=1 Tax=Listeria booriae TaxID=1552123 RepID=UPI00162568A0|nr:hypothetical protein [Listeria booriae]MBC1523744.1 hypothetical protein [Listeria booriae]